MNCANHSDRERVAFCQNCGKPLCAECVRHLGSSILCEPCLALRTAGAGGGPVYGGVPPMGGPIPPMGGAMPPVMEAGPNPAVAALLGFIPGVGAMYNEQYGKGIVHLIVFAILVTLASDVNGIFGLFIAGWEFYMAIEAHHTARARRDGMPLPNPFGLNDISERMGFGKAWPPSSHGVPGTGTPGAAGFYPGGNDPQAYGGAGVPPVSHWGAPQETYAVPPVTPEPVAPYIDARLPYYRRVPSGAIWLIALGVFFLLGNAGFHIISGRMFGPFLLIGIGVATFVSRMTRSGLSLENDGTELYRWRLTNALHGAAWMVVVGVIWLLDVVHILRWSRSWPLFLIATGVLMMLRRTMTGGFMHGAGYQGPAPPVAPPSAPVSSTQIVPAASQMRTDRDDADDSTREGR